jgi:hypothetical protein
MRRRAAGFRHQETGHAILWLGLMSGHPRTTRGSESAASAARCGVRFQGLHSRITSNKLPLPERSILVARLPDLFRTKIPFNYPVCTQGRQGQNVLRELESGGGEVSGPTASSVDLDQCTFATASRCSILRAEAGEDPAQPGERKTVKTDREIAASMRESCHDLRVP